ncbi:HAD-IIB family hydrolase [Cohnella soli]|uniref:HAD-IIB family hydrolase n=1 Tax=Cohnella soli TaxID=425005 RepID=A0ABW0HKU3_9BACL
MKFVFDLDGTICYQGKPLSNDMVCMLDRIANEGHEVIVASARPIRDLLPILPIHMHQIPMVGGNGSFVYKNGLHVSSSRFEPSVADQIVGLLVRYKAKYLIDSLWNYSYSGDPEHPIRKNLDPEIRAQNVPVEDLEEIVKIVVLNSMDQQSLLNELKHLPIRMYTHGTEDIIDISPASIDKWNGLQSLDVESYRYIAFGNDANDVPMFQHALHSVCVGEHAELRRLASESVACDEQSVINKINELLISHSLAT